MQSAALYGRLIARAFISGFNSDLQVKRKDPYHFVTGTSGFSKSPLSKTCVKKWTFGDDAYFIAKNKESDVIGVADGVGGWRNYGIDPSAFPHTLMETCERMVKEGRFKPQSPANIIADSYEEVLQQKLPMMGSTTACVVALHREESTIYTANIGDSGFLLIRNDEVIHRSVEQQHYFNTPFQLAVAPPSQQGLVLSDSPDMADSTSYKVEEGDIVLLGTDGLFDNMHEDQILHYISKLKDYREESVQKTAHRIAEDALHLSFDEEYISPFSEAAKAAGIPDFKGGKPDDITVVLARVSCLE